MYISILWNTEASGDLLNVEIKEFGKLSFLGL